MDHKSANILEHLSEAANVLSIFVRNKHNIENISTAVSIFVNSIKNGGKILSCGNGGSHCDAMHFAEELTGRYRNNRKALPAICISDASHITCVGNDFGFDKIYSRFLEALGNENDVLLAISTSGNSANVIEAAKVAKEKNMKIIALTGKDGGLLKNYADVEIRVEHDGFADRIQEIHIKIIHIFIDSIEKNIFNI